MPTKGLGIWNVRPIPMRQRSCRGRCDDVLAFEDDLAAVGVHSTGDQVEPGGLTRPVGTDDTESLTVANADAQIVDHQDPAERLPKALGFKRYCQVESPPPHHPQSPFPSCLYMPTRRPDRSSPSTQCNRMSHRAARGQEIPAAAEPSQEPGRNTRASACCDPREVDLLRPLDGKILDERLHLVLRRDIRGGGVATDGQLEGILGALAPLAADERRLVDVLHDVARADLEGRGRPR